MLKALFEGRFSAPVAWLLKFLCFFVGTSLTVGLGVAILFPQGLVWQARYLVLLLPLAFVFWIYDLAFTRLITFYVVRLRHRFRFLNKP